mgnify:CR=1 FL=1
MIHMLLKRKEKKKKKYLNINQIKKRIEEGKDIIGRNETYNAVNLDEKFPEFILNNIEIYQDWIINK